MGNSKTLHAWPRWCLGICLAVLVLGGGYLRLAGLTLHSLWADELFTLSMAYHHPLVPEGGEPWFRATTIFEIRDADTFLTAKAAEQSPPLQDLLEKLSIQFLGPTELGARLPGALLSCVLLCWFAAVAWRREDPWEQRVLAWALLFLALSPALVGFAKDGRAYSLGASLVGAGGLLWMLRWRHGWRDWVPPGWWEILFLTLACYAHYNAAALVAIMLVPDALVATVRRSWRAWSRLLVLGAVFAVWLGFNSHTILFTAKGGVAWGQFSAAQMVFETIRGALEIAHPAWLLLALGGVWLLVARRALADGEVLLPRRALMLFALMSLVLLYVAVAGKIVAKAGMAHPRYYIFMAPLLAVAYGLVFAEIRHRWLLVLAALLVAGLAARDLRRLPLNTYEEFRQMTRAAVEDMTDETIVLYPWKPNRDLYRIYLERFTGRDMRARMVAISDPQEVAQVCERLATAAHVAVIAHGSGRQRIDNVYAACGARWPQRQQRIFDKTFSESWRAAPATQAPAR